jgi:hypothetical protein
MWEWYVNNEPMVGSIAIIIFVILCAIGIGELFTRITCPIKSMRDVYEDGVCPDCQDQIPIDCVDGQACNNCGHVFFYPRLVDDWDGSLK